MVEDTPQDLVHDSRRRRSSADPLGRPVIGRAEVIASISPASLLGYHRGAYVGPNVVLAAAGNVDHERSSRRCERHNGDGPAAPAPEPQAAGRAPRGRRSASSEEDRAVPRLPRRARDLPRRPRRYASALLDAILGGSASSRLFQEIREKRGMAYSVYTYGSQYVDAGQIGIYVGTREETCASASSDRGRAAGRRGREHQRG